MNRRRFFLTISAAAVLAAGPAFADFVSDVQAQLRAQGYRQITVSKTMLGRVHIMATGKGGTREVIMNPRTGEILRDLWTSASGKDGPSIVGSGHTQIDEGEDDTIDDPDDPKDDPDENSEDDSEDPDEPQDGEGEDSENADGQKEGEND